MASRFENFEKLTSGLQSIAVIIGLIVGGIWSFYVFGALGQKERALAELEAERLAVEKASNEAQRVLPQVSLTVAPLTIQRDTCIMQVNANINNAGNKTIQLRFPQAPLQIAVVHYKKGVGVTAEPLFEVPLRSFSLDRDSVVGLPRSRLLVGESSSYPFLIRVLRKKTYLLEFSVPADTVNSSNPTSEPTSTGWTWTARTYVSDCKAGGTPEK